MPSPTEKELLKQMKIALISRYGSISAGAKALGVSRWSLRLATIGRCPGVRQKMLKAGVLTSFATPAYRAAQGVASNSVVGNAGSVVIGAANSRPITGDEFEQITPWGNFPNPQGLQRLNKQVGQRMVTAFNSFRDREGSAFRGLPIYCGHPDVDPQHYKDDRRYGRIDELEARDDGLWCRPTFNELGRKNQQEGYWTYPSGVWKFKRVGGGVIEPTELLSVGLTNSPITGITSRTIFFQKIGAALGLATCQRKAQELQSKIEDFFTRSKMMLVLDEAHYAWPQRLRVESAPELIDWIDTALVNQGVPVALLCTDQFAKLKNRVERQTGWTSEQFMHRVFRYQQLLAPTREDVTTVTRALLSCAWDEKAEAWTPATRACSEAAVEALAAYAMVQRTPLACVSSSIDDARLRARKEGRTVITAKDVWAALEGGQVPSDAALVRAFMPASAEGRARRSIAPATPATRSKAYASIRRDETETPSRVNLSAAMSVPAKLMEL